MPSYNNNLSTSQVINDYLCLPFSILIIFLGHLLVRDVPEAQLPVQGAAEEELVVARVEGDGGDKVNVLEHAQTLLEAKNWLFSLASQKYAYE